MDRAPTVDVFTAEIIRNGLTACAYEMSKTLARTAHSTLLYDVQDFGVGVLGADGAVWGETPGITIFTGCLPEVIKSALRKYGRDGFADGDVLLVNDPYETGTHVSDNSVYIPVFHSGELVAFTISTAHWADVGAKAPGGWCPDSTDVYQEGVCFSHQKLIAAGRRNRDVWDIIESNVRLPETVIGDLEAQIAACRLGAARVQALCTKYGRETVRAAMASHHRAHRGGNAPAGRRPSRRDLFGVDRPRLGWCRARQAPAGQCVPDRRRQLDQGVVHGIEPGRARTDQSAGPGRTRRGARLPQVAPDAARQDQ